MIKHPRAASLAALAAALAGCDLPVGAPGASAHARVDATVLAPTGQPAAGVEVTVREARPALPYQFTSDLTDAQGRASVTIWRLGGPAPSSPDTMSFVITARRGEPAVRDSVSVVVRFAPTREAVPTTSARLTISSGG
ncbi:hypothetical protein [Longimicrobium sp.]|uniref:hypothetical protein n=1 Tax=Longimicrobium sp. TaxID=2029185 RepID=UPI002F9513E9